MAEFKFKQRYEISDLLDIVRLLRAPGGCPWDREQDHRSIRRNFIEETYEAAEAIDMGDAELLCEELGDVLLQVVLHAQMEDEAGRFRFADVCDGVCKKLIIRHPHVFGDAAVSSTSEVLRNWDAIKARTKGQTTASQTLESVPKTLPALMRAEKICSRARKAGPEPRHDIRWAAEHLADCAARFQSAAARGGLDEQRRALGDMLFAAAGAAQTLGADPEQALNDAAESFASRFAAAEQAARGQGLSMKSCPAEDWDACWRAAKEE